jgi:hypothetical protein
LVLQACDDTPENPNFISKFRKPIPLTSVSRDTIKHLARFGFIYGNKQTLRKQYIQVLHSKDILTLVRNIRSPGHEDLIPQHFYFPQVRIGRGHNSRFIYHNESVSSIIRNMQRQVTQISPGFAWNGHPPLVHSLGQWLSLVTRKQDSGDKPSACKAAG